jgi:hypothetical protein
MYTKVIDNLLTHNYGEESRKYIKNKNEFEMKNK